MVRDGMEERRRKREVRELFLAEAMVMGILGGVTGIYPARRATRISALDALRYE